VSAMSSGTPKKIALNGQGSATMPAIDVQAQVRTNALSADNMPYEATTEPASAKKTGMMQKSDQYTSVTVLTSVKMIIAQGLVQKTVLSVRKTPSGINSGNAHAKSTGVNQTAHFTWAAVIIDVKGALVQPSQTA
jgi:hypothetical protein